MQDPCAPFAPVESPSGRHVGASLPQRSAALEGSPANVVPVAAEAIDMGALLRFKSLMAACGLPVQLPRMCFDRLYAFHCIAQAHAGGSDPLRRLALELFQAYHRRDENRQILTS